MRKFIVLAFTTACASTSPPPTATTTTNGPPGPQLAWRAEFPPAEAMVGISGLTRHPTTGVYYAVSERDPLLFPIVIQSSGQPVVGTPIPIEGMPAELDLESIAFVDANTLVIGTESKDEARTDDAILYAAFTPEKVSILDERTRTFFDYGAYAVRPDPNRGVEAICSYQATLIAVTEHVMNVDGKRFGAVQRYDPLTRGWTPHLVALTSTDGKIAGIACSGGATKIEVVAIERHYGTMRLIRFAVPMRGTAMARLDSTLVMDLAPVLGPQPKNFEGIEVSPKGGLYLISDNSHGGLDGPTTMIHVTSLGQDFVRYGGSVE